MGLLDDMKGKADELDKTYNPMRKVADAIATPQPTAADTARQEAVARGDAARQEAIDRGKGIEVKIVGDPIQKEPM